MGTPASFLHQHMFLDPLIQHLHIHMLLQGCFGFFSQICHHHRPSQNLYHPVLHFYLFVVCYCKLLSMIRMFIPNTALGHFTSCTKDVVNPLVSSSNSPCVSKTICFCVYVGLGHSQVFVETQSSCLLLLCSPTDNFFQSILGSSVFVIVRQAGHLHIHQCLGIQPIQYALLGIAFHKHNQHTVAYIPDGNKPHTITLFRLSLKSVFEFISAILVVPWNRM